MANRGELKNINRAAQVIKFEGMRWGKITPTDIDLAIEARGAYVFGEFKLQGKKLDFGQRLALENLSRDVKPAPCLMFIAEHKTPFNEPVIAKDCNVVECHWNGKKLNDSQLNSVFNVKHLVDKFLLKTRNLDSYFPERTTSTLTPESSAWLADYDAAETAQ